jgi:hypothetical protein
MSTETRIPQGQRGVELYEYGGLRILGPSVLNVFVGNWGAGNEDDADSLGVSDELHVKVTFQCIPLSAGLLETFDVDVDEPGEGVETPIGRYYATVVEIGSTTVAVTSTAMSRLSLPKILRAAVAGISGEFRVATVDPETGDFVARSFAEPSELGIAGAWAYGRLLGEDPTKYVQTAFGLKSRQAAAQRVGRARKAGHLPPTKQGAH